MKKEELDPSYTRPFIGTKKKYTVLPIYTFRRKMVPLTPLNLGPSIAPPQEYW